MIGGLFGLGLALLIVHNPARGELFQPAWGYWLLIIALFIGTASKIKTLPDTIKHSLPAIVLPLFLVVLMMIANSHGNIRFLNGPTLSYTPDIILLFFPLLFLFVRQNPKALSIPFAIVTILATISIVFTAVTTGLKSGGWVTVENYDAIIPLLCLGTLLAPLAWRHWMAGVSIVGLFFSGSEIGLLAFIMICTIMLIRRDWSCKLNVSIMALVACIAIATPLGLTEKLWIQNEVQGALGERIHAGIQALNGGGLSDLDFLISGNRLTQTWHIRPVTLTGYGLVIDNLNHATPHNQLLILMEQIGALGALAWVLATIAWGIKYKNYYILGLLFIIGTFDHFFWTIGVTWWWALVGLGEQGLIFRRPRSPNGVSFGVRDGGRMSNFGLAHKGNKRLVIALIIVGLLIGSIKLYDSNRAPIETEIDRAVEFGSGVVSVIRSKINVIKANIPIIKAASYSELFNDYREENGRLPLTFTDDLNRIAELRLKEIQIDFSHNSKGKYNQDLAENIVFSFGFLSDWGAFTSWRNSPGHNANLLDASYRYTGYAIGNSYAVQVFTEWPPINGVPQLPLGWYFP